MNTPERLRSIAGFFSATIGTGNPSLDALFRLVDVRIA